MELVLKSGSEAHSLEHLRHFCSEWQWHWQSHRWHYWPKIYTVDWQYKLSTYCTYSPQVYRGVSSVLQQTEASNINKDPSPL